MVDAVDADETRELAVGVEDHVTVHEHSFVDALAELGEQSRPGFLAARGARGTHQQLVDGDAEGLQVQLFLVYLDALRKPFARQRTLDRQGQLCHRPQIAPLEHEQHEQQRRHECEQHADQPKNRHPQPGPVVISASNAAEHSRTAAG